MVGCKRVHVKFQGLDTFRLLAFAAVFLYHVEFLPIGYLGVTAFFVLSGFLITPILVDMRQQLPPLRFFINFYGRRCLRIFPLYYLYLAAMLALAVLALVVPGVPRAVLQIQSQIVYGLTYTYDFFHASSWFVQSPLLTHLWSLAVEEQFYLVWPLIVFWVSRARLSAVLAGLIVAGPLIRLIELALIGSEFGRFLNPRADLTIYVLPFSHLDAFATGGYLALYGRTPRRATVGLYALALLAVGMISERMVSGSTGLTLGYPPFMSGSWKPIWGYTAFNILFGWVILLIRDRALARPVMENPALSYLGKISYGLYVYHFAMIWLVSVAAGAPFYHQPPGRRVMFGAVALALTIVTSIVSYVAVEERFLRLKDRYFARSASDAAAMGPLQPTYDASHQNVGPRISQ